MADSRRRLLNLLAPAPVHGNRRSLTCPLKCGDGADGRLVMPDPSLLAVVRYLGSPSRQDTIKDLLDHLCCGDDVGVPPDGAREVPHEDHAPAGCRLAELGEADESTKLFECPFDVHGLTICGPRNVLSSAGTDRDTALTAA